MKHRTDCTYWIFEGAWPYVEAPSGHWIWRDGAWHKHESQEDWNARIPVDMPDNWWEDHFGNLPELPE